MQFFAFRRFRARSFFNLCVMIDFIDRLVFSFSLFCDLLSFACDSLVFSSSCLSILASSQFSFIMIFAFFFSASNDAFNNNYFEFFNSFEVLDLSADLELTLRDLRAHMKLVFRHVFERESTFAKSRDS